MSCSLPTEGSMTLSPSSSLQKGGVRGILSKAKKVPDRPLAPRRGSGTALAHRLRPSHLYMLRTKLSPRRIGILTRSEKKNIKTSQEYPLLRGLGGYTRRVRASAPVGRNLPTLKVPTNAQKVQRNLRASARTPSEATVGYRN